MLRRRQEPFVDREVLRSVVDIKEPGSMMEDILIGLLWMLLRVLLLRL